MCFRLCFFFSNFCCCCFVFVRSHDHKHNISISPASLVVRTLNLIFPRNFTLHSRGCCVLVCVFVCRWCVHGCTPQFSLICLSSVRFFLSWNSFEFYVAGMEYNTHCDYVAQAVSARVRRKHTNKNPIKKLKWKCRRECDFWRIWTCLSSSLCLSLSRIANSRRNEHENEMKILYFRGRCAS